MHERVDPAHNFGITKTDLPHRLAIQFHDCGNYTATNIKRYRGGPPICGNCDKVVPWFFFKCVSCDTYFVKDFRHPKFCDFYPTCWEHTLVLPWRYCTKHKADPDEFELCAVIVEPIGLNPKVFSDEDLADVFDF